ncbi:MAG: ribosome biogenesis/translation initiation ATPase RLI [Candidatus Aenigmarchaeota archaeon]|nr:ribosome biogenesis/translation initiation ATPase RLI [Candidatus Aenigmarchaeota archaeon]
MTRVAVIDRELCKPKKCDYLCIRVCPRNRSGDKCIITDEVTKFPIIDESICIGCGICIHKCPFGAIKIVNLPEKLKEKPIHRFGRNQFLLFRLPYPIPGQIVGLIGSNGLGKTTTLMILSGQIKPNLGESKKKFDFSELITLFRGTELQNYLEKLKEKQIKVSFKLQRVDKIPETYSGKVSKLLSKTDERGILNDLISRFGLEEIQDDDIKSISGGELQRVAITACLAKDADIYYFDEPTSFLDVFQRLEVSKAIKEFCQDKSVMIADHDLATLDFLADQIHIFYGSPSVYGVISSPYSVRTGINTFLDGYIREDNVRIRTTPIKFESTYIQASRGSNVLMEFSDIKKKLGDFSLTVKKGELYGQEVLGILGANALGKTILARILAGEIKQDSGEVIGKIKISYKSQYPKTDYDGTVRELLKSVSKEVETENFKAEVMRPLELDKLLERQVKNLSGGELQRTAIAVALSKEADVYLLDEPSAFLDVEMRLSLASMIRRIVEKRSCSAMIIDHDLLFLSQIADRGMVFLGKPGKEGHAEEPKKVEDAFNSFLSIVGVTFRKDPQTGRPRANKLGSKLDREQKDKGKYFM